MEFMVGEVGYRAALEPKARRRLRYDRHGAPERWLEAGRLFFGGRFTKVCIEYLGRFAQIPTSRSGPGHVRNTRYKASAN